MKQTTPPKERKGGAKDFNNHSTKHIQMPNTSVKRCATPSVIRQTQWDVSAHALILKRLTVPSSGEDTRATGNSLLHLWRNHNVAQAVRKTVWQFLKVTQINACLPLPGMNPGERKAYIHTKAHAQMSAAGLCIIAKNGKQPKCSWTGGCPKQWNTPPRS